MKFIITFALIGASMLFGAQNIIVFHAGSLSVPFKQIKQAFEKEYSQYNVVLKPAGSITCAKNIYEKKEPCDVMASADYKVIDNLLIPKDAKFNAKFATNEMVIAYTDKSKFANEINSKNWTDIFLKDGVKVGHSNPNLDPCGYRAMLVTKLASTYYKKPNFYNELFGYGKNYEIGKENTNKIVVRPKESELLELLENGEYDYLYIYKSVAAQHRLKYINLPDEISLKSSDLTNFYNQVSFDITGKQKDTFTTKKGSAMVYGITIIENERTPNLEGAKLFVKFVLSPKGQKIMQENGQGVINPAIITGDDTILKK